MMSLGRNNVLFLQAACDKSIARVTGCVDYTLVKDTTVVGDSPANARVKRTKTFNLVLRTETV